MILGFIYILITIYLLKNLHIQVYNWKSHIVEEYDFELKVWHLIILMLYLIPIFIIQDLLFLVFITYFTIHCIWDPYSKTGTTHVFSLKSNILTRFLNKKI